MCNHALHKRGLHNPVTHPHHMTDIMDGQGGSALFIRILNRLGVCSSLESLNRYMQDSVPIGKTVSIMPSGQTALLLSHWTTLILCTANAHIFKSSWHGTSIQAVLPFLSEASDNFDPESVKRTRPESSMPALAPKVKRPRTGTESCVLVPGPSNTPNMSNTCTTSGHVQVYTRLKRAHKRRRYWGNSKCLCLPTF